MELVNAGSICFRSVQYTRIRHTSILKCGGENAAQRQRQFAAAAAAFINAPGMPDRAISSTERCAHSGIGRALFFVETQCRKYVCAEDAVRPRFSDLTPDIEARSHAVPSMLPMVGGSVRAQNDFAAHKPTAARHDRNWTREMFGPALPLQRTAGPLGFVDIDHSRVDVIVLDKQSRLPLGRAVSERCQQALY